jgi:fimbrial chaperone protein
MRTLPRLALFATLWAGSAFAAGIRISPILVELTQSQTNAIVSLRNDSDSSVRYQISAVNWTQDDAGQMKLAPTKDLIVFPQLVTLKAGEERNLRVGVTGDKFGTLEKSYRVFVEEMPPPGKVGDKPAVQVLTRLSIPVFLEPAHLVGAARIEGPRFEAGKLVFRLRNMGNIRVRPSEILVEAKGADKKLDAQKRWDGWYVLAAGDRIYEWTLPKDGCGQVRSIQIEARFEQGEPARATVDVPRGACPP